jgi:hypothetical protein
MCKLAAAIIDVVRIHRLPWRRSPVNVEIQNTFCVPSFSAQTRAKETGRNFFALLREQNKGHRFRAPKEDRNATLKLLLRTPSQSYQFRQFLFLCCNLVLRWLFGACTVFIHNHASISCYFPRWRHAKTSRLSSWADWSVHTNFLQLQSSSSRRRST